MHPVRLMWLNWFEFYSNFHFDAPSKPRVCSVQAARLAVHAPHVHAHPGVVLLVIVEMVISTAGYDHKLISLKKINLQLQPVSATDHFKFCIKNPVRRCIY